MLRFFSFVHEGESEGTGLWGVLEIAPSLRADLEVFLMSHSVQLQVMPFELLWPLISQSVAAGNACLLNY